MKSGGRRLIAASWLGALALLAARPVSAHGGDTSEQAQPLEEDELLEGGDDLLEELEAEEAEEVLDEEALQTPEVVVTGTRIERATEDAPVRTQVIGRDQIEQRKARNVAEALSYTTGVRVETNCQNCGFTQLRLNGLGGAYTQVLIDGLPSFSGLAAVYGLEQLPSELIRRVEVVKGGGSALYGASAVAGVVNLITRRPERNFASALISHDWVGLGAPDLRASVDGGVVGAGGRLGAHLFATTRRRGELDLNGDGFSELTRTRQFAGGTNIFAEPVDGARLRLSFYSVQEYRRGGDVLDQPAHEAAIAEELQTERLQGELRWEHQVSPALAYSMGYVLAFTERRSYYGGGGDVEPVAPEEGAPVEEEFLEDFEAERVALGGYGRTRNPLHVGDAHLDYSYDLFGPQVLTVGAQASIDDVQDRYLGYDRVIDDVYTIIGAYAQHDWIFADWGESVLGVRVDQHSELEEPIASPRAALMLRPANWLRLRSAFSTGFRAPQPFDEDLHIETVGGAARLIENAPDLAPERSMSFTQQARASFDLPGGQDLALGVSGYYTNLRDAFVLNERDDPATPEEEMVRSNRGATTVLGAELEASVNAPWWALRLGWTFEGAENDEPDEDFGRARIYRTPRHYGYADGLIKKGGLEVQSGVSITGPMLVPRYDANGAPLEVNTSPWSFDWNANVAFARLVMDAAALEPFIGVRNILDSRQRDFDEGAARDAGYVYGPAQPRAVFVGVRGML